MGLDLTQPLPHGAEGSDTACAVLLVLHRRPDGASLAQIATLLQADVYDVRQAIEKGNRPA